MVKTGEIWRLFKEEKENPEKWFVENGVKGGVYPSSFSSSCASDKEIVAAEKETNTEFSSSYKYYLKEFGGGAPTCFQVYGIKKERKDYPDRYTVTGMTNHYRHEQNWPGTHEWYVVCSDHDGNPYGVDKDGKVWISDHDTQEIILVADDFEEFLYLLYTDTMWDNGYRKVIPWDEYLEKHKNK